MRGEGHSRRMRREALPARSRAGSRGTAPPQSARPARRGAAPRPRSAALHQRRTAPASGSTAASAASSPARTARQIASAGVASGEQADRGVRHERDAFLLLGRKRREPREIERLDIVGMDGAAHRPFEPRDIGEIGERRGGRKGREERGERLAIVVEAGRARRVLRDERRSRTFEEFVADQLVDRGIGQPQRAGRVADEGVAIDVEPVRRDAVGEQGRRCGTFAVDEPCAHGALCLKQRRHRAPPASPLRATRRRWRLRRAARRAAARRCPIR